jgi:hypothetical protein
VNAWPLALALPDGITAEYVPNTRPPRYTIDGEPTTIDVTIPDDLAAAGWIWHGTTLRWPASDPLRGIAIVTCSYPPPGYPSIRGTCFDIARQFEAGRHRRAEQRIAERVAIVTKAPKPKKDAPVAEAVQMELF